MANYVSQQLGKIDKNLLNLTQDGSSVLTGVGNKLWRAAILLHRATHYPHQDISKVNPAKGNNTLKNKLERESKERAKGEPIIQFNIEKYDSLTKAKPANSNQVILYNLTSKPYEYIIIQNRPKQIEFKGETSWASIKSMGRNVPMYHFTGAEDIVQFNISWYCNDPEHRDEVVNKCRFLEAWTKSNGYQASPPVIKIQWGDSGIFDDHYYILTSATYTLDNFNDYYSGPNRDRNNPNNWVTNGKLLPSTATQELIFKRVSATNPTWNDILPVSKMEYTRGLNKP